MGKAFIVVGLMMFAFVAYQLWGTGIQTAQAQNDLEAQFRDAMQSTTTIAPTTTTSPPATTHPSSSSTTSTSTTSTVPVAASTPPVPSGDPIGVLTIPTLGIHDLYIVEDVGVPDLKKGPGHFRETPMPGQLGNAAIAGHRTTYGAPFYHLDRLQPGDLIEVDTFAGHFTYSVTSTFVVHPEDYASVIPTVDPTVATLTLATCTPAYTARDRLIVKADLVPDQSDTVMAPPSATVPESSTPATTVPETLPGESVPTTSPDTTSPDTTIVPALDPGTASAGDAFAKGWFDDTSAIPQTLLWGLLLLGICVGSFYVGKAAQRLWVSYLVGFIPFVIVLYFFFENVNRLLPPSL